MTSSFVDVVLEYIDGIKLHDLLFQTRLSEVQARELSFQLCRAVAFFHEKAVSHGDMKTDNVLVIPGDRPKIKIIDFGLANVYGTYNMDQIITDTIFTAPEAHPQEVSEAAITNTMSKKWDDWGVGCIVFCILSSQHPFLPNRTVEPAFNPAFDEILWHALSRNTYEAQDFVRNLLVAYPDDRMTSQAALSHPWLLGYEPYRVSFAGVPFKPLPVDGDGAAKALARGFEFPLA